MIKFFVPGTPAPAGSKTAFVLKRAGQYTGRAIVTDACKRTKPWQQEVKFAALEYMAPNGTAREAMALVTTRLLEGPLRLTLTFHMLRPKNHYGSGKNAAMLKSCAPRWPTVKPDVLKLARAVEDALTGIIWRDDSQIVFEVLAKGYAEKSGVWIQIEEMT